MKRFKEQSAYLVSLFILTVFIVLPGCSGIFGGGSWNKPNPPAITAYSLAVGAGAGVAGTINETTKTISVTMPFGTVVTAMTATYTTTGTSVKVAGVLQSSGTVPTNNFTSPVLYTVTGADGSTASYTVTVTVAPIFAKAITSYSIDGIAGVISEATNPKTISVVMPYGTDLTIPRTATFLTSGTSVRIGAATQTSGVTTNVIPLSPPSSAIYTVSAADNSTATYNVNVTVATSSAKAITSYSINGIAGIVSEATTPKTISVVMPYGTDLTIPMTATYLTTGTNVKIGAVTQTSGVTTNVFPLSPPSSAIYTVTANDNTTATYNVNVTVATSSAKAITSYSLDGIAGIISEATTPKTISVVMPYGTDLTLPMTGTYLTTGTSVKIGAAVQTSGATTNVFPASPPSSAIYTVTANDNSTATYNLNVTVATSSAKAITSYSLNGIAGIISEATTPKTISVIMPFGTDLTLPMTATYLTTGTSVKIGAAVQTSGITTNIFPSSPPSSAIYTVTANDNSTATYNLNVTVATSAAKAITSYSIDGIAGIISESTSPKTILVVMPSGTDLALPMIASYLTTGTSVKIGAVVQTSGITTNVFPLSPPASAIYTVTASDNSTATYNVNVTVAQSSAKLITSYSLDGIAGVISESTTPKTISVVMPSGTDLSLPMTATYTTTGTSVKIGLVAQTSGVTTNVFPLSPPASKIYTVTAADNSTATYNVNVTVALGSGKAITSYSLDGIAGVVNEAAKTIAVTMPSGTDLTVPMTATYLTTGVSVAIGATLQSSGLPPTNVFNPSQTYRVTAADATFVDYVVTVTVPPALALNLRSVATFGIAARAGMTSTGLTVVNGDVALWPTATCTDSTGGPGGASQSCLFKAYASATGMTVNGSIYWFGDPFDNGGTANAVTNDLNIAWTEGMNKVVNRGSVGGQLSSVAPYLPGVYNDANLNFASGGVATLDAQNDANAVFIFQVGTIGGAGDFTASDSGAEIKLINGAQAKNVWFVVGRDVVIGLGTIWNGNILAGRDVTVKAGATVLGRVLAGANGAGAFVLTGAATPVTTITVP